MGLQILRITNFNSATVSSPFGTMFQQQLCNVVMALPSSSLERCMTRPLHKPPLDVHIRSMTEQQPHDLQMSVPRRQIYRGTAISRSGVHGSPMLEEELHHLGISVVRREMQGHPFGRILRVHVGPVVE